MFNFILGFWPNDQQKFGLLSIHTNEYLKDRPPNFGELEHQEAVHAQAILASFAWLIGQASYQGKKTRLTELFICIYLFFTNCTLENSCNYKCITTYVTLTFERSHLLISQQRSHGVIFTDLQFALILTLLSYYIQIINKKK